MTDVQVGSIIDDHYTNDPGRGTTDLIRMDIARAIHETGQSIG